MIKTINSIDDIFSSIEGKYPSYFQSRQSLIKGEPHLRINECITIEAFEIPAKSQRIPGVLYRNYLVSDNGNLPTEIYQDVKNMVADLYAEN